MDHVEIIFRAVAFALGILFVIKAGDKLNLRTLKSCMSQYFSFNEMKYVSVS